MWIVIPELWNRVPRCASLADLGGSRRPSARYTLRRLNVRGRITCVHRTSVLQPVHRYVAAIPDIGSAALAGMETEDGHNIGGRMQCWIFVIARLLFSLSAAGVVAARPCELIMAYRNAHSHLVAINRVLVFADLEPIFYGLNLCE